MGKRNDISFQQGGVGWGWWRRRLLKIHFIKKRRKKEGGKRMKLEEMKLRSSR
jgi:hypothetical protein